MNWSDVKHLTVSGKNAVRLSVDGKVFWKGLPNGYKKLEYIETTGTQYIDTSFNPNQDTRFVCEFMWKGTGGSGNRDIYGGRQSAEKNTFWLRVVYDKWQPNYNTVLGNTGVSADTTNWHIADQHKNFFYIDGVLIREFEYAPFQSPAPLAIGGGYATYGGGTFYPGVARYRGCQLYDNGVLIRDFIPCKDADGKIGMYDTVNAVFYGNAGTGAFLFG